MQRFDLGRVVEIEKRSFPSPWTKLMIEREFNLGHSLSFVFEDDGEVKGYVFARVVAEELHILNLAVADQFRRKGIGELLLSHVLEQGMTAGCENAFLEVRTHNLAAIRLYNKAGFAVIRKRNRYYEDGSDAYEMGARLELALRSLDRRGK